MVCPACNEPVETGRVLGTQLRAAGLGFGAFVSCRGCLGISSVAVTDLAGGTAPLAPFQQAVAIVTGAVVKRVKERLERAWENETLPEEIASLVGSEDTRLALRVPEVFAVGQRAFPDVCRVAIDTYVLDARSPAIDVRTPEGRPAAPAAAELQLEPVPPRFKAVTGVAGIAGALDVSLPFRVYRRGLLLTRRGASTGALRVEPTDGSQPGIVLATLDLVEPA